VQPPAREALGAAGWQGLLQHYLGSEGAPAAAAAPGAGPPAPLQYWALAPGARLRALLRLCHAALDMPLLRRAQPRSMRSGAGRGCAPRL